MSDGLDRAAAREATGSRPDSLTISSFISALASIAPDASRPITPESHLIDDLGFEMIAFSRLGLLVYERYGVGGLSTASLQPENLTVEAFFRSCIVEVIGAAGPRHG